MLPLAIQSSRWLSEWLLFNANSAIFHLYHRETFQWDDDEARFILDHTELDFYSVSSLQQQIAGKHVAPLGLIILIPSLPVFVLNAACLAEQQQMPMLKSLVWPDRGSNPWSAALEESMLTITPQMRLIIKMCWRFRSHYRFSTATFCASLKPGPVNPTWYVIVFVWGERYHVICSYWCDWLTITV